jgi:hypothetical protein
MTRPDLRRPTPLCAVLLIVASWASPARAVGLSFLPTEGSFGLTEPIEVAVVVSGLGNAGAPSVGDFDIAVTFAADALVLDDVLFGGFLGAPGVETIDSWSIEAPGLVRLAELSLMRPRDLDALQSDSFALATLSFSAASLGTSPLAFGSALVGDAFGAPLTVSPLAPGTVTVAPEPASGALLALGLGGLAAIARHRTHRGGSRWNSS